MKKISLAVKKRLPRYYRYLSDLLEEGVERISSKELSDRMGVTASQVRQDFSCFGGFGQQGYGYNIEYLHNEIGKILGVTDQRNVIIVGVGRIGQALANYSYFEREGFNIVGCFDVADDKVGTEIRGIKVMHYNELENFVKENKVDIAVLSVPYRETRDVAKKLEELGVKGFWNFSAMDLKLSEQSVIENVHLVDSLMVLGYNLKEEEEHA